MQVQGRFRQVGVTLVDSAVVLGVTAVLLGTGLPSLGRAYAIRVLDAAAAELRTDIQYARSTAVALGQTVRVRVQSDDAGSCYVIHTGGPSACSCTPAGGAVCGASGNAMRSVQFTAGHAVKLSTTSTSMAFDGTQGTVTPTGSVSLANQRGDQLKLVVNIMGRTRSCRVSGQIIGHPAC